MEIPPAERLKIYEKMLPYFEGEERLLSGWRTPVLGFCKASLMVTKVLGALYMLPELTKRNPTNGMLFWFPVVEDGPDHTRTNILHQAIEEVKQLI